MKIPLLCVLLASHCLAFAADTNNASTVKSQDPEANSKPRLEDFATYNDFLRAMYLHKKTEEETAKPTIVITPPSTGQSYPEYSPMDKERDVTSWGEDMPAQPALPVE